MSVRNVSLKSIALSDDSRTLEKDVFPSLGKQNGMRKLIVGGALLALLTGVCFAQRGSAHAALSAQPAPNAVAQAPNANPVGPNVNTVAPTANTQAPNVNTADPNVNTVAPDANPVGPNANPSVTPDVNAVAPDANPVAPRDMNQKPPISPNAEVSPDAAPPSPQP